MDFDTKVSILSDLILWRNDLDDRLLDYFLMEANDLAVRYAVGIDLGHIHQLSGEAEVMIDKAFYNLLWEFGKDANGEYSNIRDILPASITERDPDYVFFDDDRSMA